MMSRKLCKYPAKRGMLRFRANHYIEAVDRKQKTYGVPAAKRKRIIPRRRMILFFMRCGVRRAQPFGGS